LAVTGKHLARSALTLTKPHRKKAARALHRTAFHTAADFAVPPLHLTLIDENENRCGQARQSWNAMTGWARREIEGMAMRERDR
jgi:hypothetical protein